MYRQQLAERGNRETTIGTTIARLRSMLRESTPMHKLSIDHLRSGYESLSGRVSADTGRNTLAEVKTWCRRMAKQGLLPVELVRSLDELEGRGARRPGEKPQLGIDQARAFRKAAISEGGQVGALCLVLLDTGLRVSELLERTGADLDDNGWVLWIRRGKTKRARRHVVLTPEARSALLALRDGDLHLFAGEASCGHRTRSWALKVVPEFCMRHGLPRVTPHGLRGTYASLQTLGKLRSLQDEMGHADERTTRESYISREVQQVVDLARYRVAVVGG